MSDWQVRARIGSDVFTAARAEEGTEAVLPALYGVSWSHELDPEEEDAWPVPDAITTATVQLLMADASAAADYDPSTTVHLEFLVPEVLAEFNAVDVVTPPVALGSSTVTSGVSHAGHTWWKVAPTVDQHGARQNVDLTDLVDGRTYEASWLVHNLLAVPRQIWVDWCDLGATSVTLQPGETRRLSTRGTRADYTSTFRFTDIYANAGAQFLVRDIWVREVQDLAVVDSFSGRGSFPVVVPHDQGVLVTISVVSYLMDLDGTQTGGEAMPEEPGQLRLNRELGTLFSPGDAWATLAARAPSNTTLLALVRDLLTYTARDVTPLHLPPGTVWELRQILPIVDEDGNLDPTPAGPWELWDFPVLEGDVFSSSPLQLRENPEAPGTWELWADPDDPSTSEWVVDANRVLFDAKLSRSIGRSVNTVHVVLADESIQTATNALPGDPVVAYALETELAEADQALGLAEHLLPGGDGEPSPWEAEAFTVLLNETPNGWYPRPLREVMALSPVQRRHHPEGHSYLVGIVSRLELAVAAGEATATVQLQARRTIGDPMNGLPIDGVPVPIDDLPIPIDAFANAR